MHAMIKAPVVFAFIATGCAAPIVQERPGDPDDNVCTPCATAGQWNRPGENPCPCPGSTDDATTPHDPDEAEPSPVSVP